MPSLTVRMSKQLHSRILELSGKERKSISEVVRLLAEEALARRQPGAADLVTMDDLQKLATQWERLFVATFANFRMVVRNLGPHGALLPRVGEEDMDLVEETLRPRQPTG